MRLPPPSAFVTVNTSTSVEDLAKLVLCKRLNLSEIDPVCRSEVENLLVGRYVKTNAPDS